MRDDDAAPRAEPPARPGRRRSARRRTRCRSRRSAGATAAPAAASTARRARRARRRAAPRVRIAMPAVASTVSRPSSASGSRRPASVSSRCRGPTRGARSAARERPGAPSAVARRRRRRRGLLGGDRGTPLRWRRRRRASVAAAASARRRAVAPGIGASARLLRRARGAARLVGELALLRLPQPDVAEPGQQHRRGEHDARTRSAIGQLADERARAGTTARARTLALSGYDCRRVRGHRARRRARAAAPQRAGARAIAASSATGSRGWFRAPRPAQHEPRADGRAPARSRSRSAATRRVLARYHELAIAFDPMLGRWVGGVRRAVEPGPRARRLRRRRPRADLAPPRRSPAHADARAAAAHRDDRRAGRARPAWVSALGFARVVELQPGADLELRGVQVIACATSHGDDELARGLVVRRARRRPEPVSVRRQRLLLGLRRRRRAVRARRRDAADRRVRAGVVSRRHMSPLDALYAFEDLRARLLVPIHHGAFALSYERLDEPARWLRRAGDRSAACAITSS